MIVASYVSAFNVDDCRKLELYSHRGQGMAKYNSHQVSEANFPHVLPVLSAAAFRAEELGRNLNAHDFIHIVPGLCSPRGPF